MWWWPLTALTLLGGLALACLVWVICDHIRHRRHARVLAELTKRYQRPPETGESVTVADLIARTRAEGHATRLHWTNESNGPLPERPRDGEWPTAILPRLPGDED